jgi:integrase
MASGALRRCYLSPPESGEFVQRLARHLRRGSASGSIRPARGGAGPELGRLDDAEGLKLGEYLGRWLEDSLKGTVRNTTYERYEQISRAHIVPIVGGVKLKALSPTHVRGLYKEKFSSLGPRTVQYIHVTLHKALKHAVSDGLIPRNATEAVKPPQVRREEIRPLTPEQVKILLDAAGRKPSRSPLRTRHPHRPQTGRAARTRVGRRGPRSRSPTGKARSDYGERRPPTRRSQDQGQSPAREPDGDCRASSQGPPGAPAGGDRPGRLPVKSTGSCLPPRRAPLDRRDLTSRRFKPLLKRAGLPHFRFHDLRHTCAMLLLTQNVNPKVASDMLGHSSIAITLDTYSHVLPKHARKRRSRPRRSPQLTGCSTVAVNGPGV